MLPDVDPQAIAKDLFWASFQNSSQFCAATKRLYVHEDIYEPLVDALVAYAQGVKVDDGSLSETQSGPLQNKMQYDKVCGLLQDSTDEGHSILLGGSPTDRTGYFIPVTLKRFPADLNRRDSQRVKDERVFVH